MLPNFENTNDLTLAFEVDERAKTQTFGIVMSPDDFDTQTYAILGLGVLGRIRLGRETSYRRMGGMIDDVEALKQSIYLMLCTEADKYIIYPYDYGITTVDLIGKSTYYIAAILPERISEALLQDDRITGVSDFDFKITKTKISVTFVVHTIYGEVDAETEVDYIV